MQTVGMKNEKESENEEKTENYFKRLSLSKDMDSEERKTLFESVEHDLFQMRRKELLLKEEYKDISRKRNELSSRLKDNRRYCKHPLLISNSRVDYLEKEYNSFAKGMNFPKLFLVFFFGSFIGVIVELLWCFIRHGYFESRSGFVFGPFNPVYGIGALILTLSLYRFRNRSAKYSFWGAFIAGSVLEYLLSFLQEKMFGSVSWDYSVVPLNIDGRICLLYSLFWGLLGILWIKGVYPMISYALIRIPKRLGLIVTDILLIFMVFNSIVSLSAVHRWSERIDDIGPSNSVGQVLDDYFPDEKMERIYPNMVFL